MKNERIKRLEQHAKKTKAAAHKRVVKDGTIQFRLNAENINRLLTLADSKRIGAGVLARMWVIERLDKELSINAKGNSLTKPFAEKLTQLQVQIDAIAKLMQEMSMSQSKGN